MISIKEYLYNLSDYPILEMAAISKGIQLGKNKYRIEIHGPSTKDRETPHIHIYLASDKNPWTKFNFEISLVDILTSNEINLIRMKDVKNNKNITNRSKCSWDNYSKMKYDFEDWLYSDEVEIRGEYIDNLDALIYWYNQEGYGENPILEYMSSRGLKISKESEIYFSDEDKEKFKDCFEQI